MNPAGTVSVSPALHRRLRNWQIDDIFVDPRKMG